MPFLSKLEKPRYPKISRRPPRLNRFPNAPLAIRSLPVDASRGFPGPLFREMDRRGAGLPAVADSDRLVHCVKHRKCWICGGQLGRYLAFAIGPMCAVNRISSEPPAHLACATFAAEACPFLSRPLAKRPDISDLESRPDYKGGPGLMLEHNPGVTLIWVCTSYQTVRVRNGVLFELGDPYGLSWFREGRAAARPEILEAFDKGLPKLRAVAEQDGPDAVLELDIALQKALTLLPA